MTRDRLSSGVEDKPREGPVRLDPPGEILADKLGALLQRAEVRDLVDTWALEAAGYPVEAALPLAMRKDAGLTPAQLSWVLSEMTLGEDTPLPDCVDLATLQRYVQELQDRLTRLSAPG